MGFLLGRLCFAVVFVIGFDCCGVLRYKLLLLHTFWVCGFMVTVSLVWGGGYRLFICNNGNFNFDYFLVVLLNLWFVTLRLFWWSWFRGRCF